jgi:hypothetical protein
MATPEQVEAVARAIGLVEEEGKDYPSDMWLVDEFTDHATAAIAAYEATRPVVSDEELRQVYADAVWENRRGSEEDWIMSGIRAVRARLEGREP